MVDVCDGYLAAEASGSSFERKPRPLAVIRNRRLNSVALLVPLRSVQHHTIPLHAARATGLPTMNPCMRAHQSMHVVGTRAAPADGDSMNDAKAVLTIANENGAEPPQPATSPTVPQQQGARNTNVLLTQPATAMHTNDPCAPSTDHDRSESGTTVAPSKATTVLARSGDEGGGGSTGAGHTQSVDSSTHASPGTSSDMCTEPAFQTDDGWPTKRRPAALNSGYA